MKRKTQKKNSIKKILLIVICVSIIAFLIINQNNVTTFLKSRTSSIAERENETYIREIGSEDELKELRSFINSEEYQDYPREMQVTLMDDIYLTEQWAPIYNFTGTFDGNGHSIHGLNMNYNIDHMALFSYNDNDFVNSDETRYNQFEIKNLGIVEPDLYNEYNGTAALVSGNYMQGTIENCYVKGGTIEGKDGVAGLVGTCWRDFDVNVDVLKSYNSAEIKGDFCVGGIMSYGMSNKFEDESNKAIIKYCYNSGNVIGHEDVGGIIGLQGFESVKYCYNVGTIEGDLINQEDEIYNIFKKYQVSEYSPGCSQIVWYGGISGESHSENFEETASNNYSLTGKSEVELITEYEMSSNGTLSWKYKYTDTLCNVTRVKINHLSVKLDHSEVSEQGILSESEMKSAEFISSITDPEEENEIWTFDTESDYKYPVFVWQKELDRNLHIYLRNYTDYGRQYLIGDADRDGVITMDDAVRTQQAVLRSDYIQEIDKLAADVNNDGEITSSDSSIITQKVLNGGYIMKAQERGEITISKGESLQLYTIWSDNKSVASPVWTSNDANIVTVNNGLITGQNIGSTKIIVSSNNKTAEINVKVINKVHIFQDEDYVIINGEKHLLGDVNGDRLINENDVKDILDEVKSSGSVSNFDELSADVNGDDKIDASDSADVSQKDLLGTFQFEAVYDRKKITINKGDTFELEAKIAQSNEEQNVQWTTSDATKVKIENVDGTKVKVTGINPGEDIEVKVIVTEGEDVSEATLKVTVRDVLEISHTIQQEIDSTKGYYIQSSIDIGYEVKKGISNISSITVETIKANAYANGNIKIDNETYDLVSNNASKNILKKEITDGDTIKDGYDGTIKINAYGEFIIRITATDNSGIKKTEDISIKNVDERTINAQMPEANIYTSLGAAEKEINGKIYSKKGVTIYFDVDDCNTPVDISIKLYDASRNDIVVNESYTSTTDSVVYSYQIPDSNYEELYNASITIKIGEIEKTTTKTIVIDGKEPENPTINITGETNNNIYRGNVKINVVPGVDENTFGGIEKTNLIIFKKINNDDYTLVSADENLTKTLTESGEYSIRAVSYDYAGNVSPSNTEEMYWENITIDNDVPSAPQINNPKEGIWTNQTLNIGISATDEYSGIAGFQYSFNPTNEWTIFDSFNPQTDINEQGTANITLQITNDSNLDKQLYIRTFDKAGNYSQYVTTRIRIDTTKPVISRAIAENGMVEVQGVDYGSGIEGYKITTTNETPADDSEWNYEGLEIVNYDASTTYYIWAKDKAGNISNGKAIEIIEESTGEPLTIKEDSNYTIDGRYIFIPDTRETAIPQSKLEENIEFNNREYKVFENDIETEENIKTGQILIVYNEDNSEDTYIIIVIHDVTKDGIVDINDVATMIDKIVTENTSNPVRFDGAQIKAGDLVKDNIIDINDVSSMIDYLISRTN